MTTSPLAQYLPPSSNGGLLPYWMLLISHVPLPLLSLSPGPPPLNLPRPPRRSATAVFNSVQNYLTTALTRKVYARSPSSVNPLQARLFGVWTLTSALIRLYAAYHLSLKPVYDLALASYALALCHFGSEALVYRTVGLQGLAGPLVVSTTSLVWMWQQYDFYVRA
ncbi:Erg28-like protein [Rhodotorula diobovata]|uniref:Erg28-like protein n=1 Tax=Rhodotorula diobovata TaxID=5288 RepID=A0A5C5FPG0_9BASI|nr:Erg28-like protein [Rhodotorula diobovata]